MNIMNDMVIKTFKRRTILLQNGYAGFPLNNKNFIVDRRVILNAKPVLENKFFGIPAPMPVKKLWNGKVCTVLRQDITKPNAHNILIETKDEKLFWVGFMDLKTYNYNPKVVKV